MAEGVDLYARLLSILPSFSGSDSPFGQFTSRGKQTVQLFKILIAEMDADRDDPGMLHGTQMRQGQVPVGYGAGAKNGFAVVDDEQNVQALWPGAQLGFSFAQTPVQVFLA